jgi:hypothetical protein
MALITPTLIFINGEGGFYLEFVEDGRRSYRYRAAPFYTTCADEVYYSTDIRSRVSANFTDSDEDWIGILHYVNEPLRTNVDLKLYRHDKNTLILSNINIPGMQTQEILVRPS